MKSINNFLSYTSILAVSAMLLSSCGGKNKSQTTGFGYNSKKWGGFENNKYKGQETGPGLVLVPAGSFVMGSTEQDVALDYNNVERTVTINSFYMDEAEISNLQYGEYVFWNFRNYVEYPEIAKRSLPDTNCWRSKLAYNEPYVEYYFRHPAYKDYPVVGVSWLQATDFCTWRTDRVNEMILDREKIHPYFNDNQNEENFNAKAYYSGAYVPKKGKKKQEKGKPIDYTSKGKKKTRREIAVKDGILLPEYRLPTEAEWEYAAQGAIGNSQYENTDEKRIYGWNDLTVRMTHGKEKDRGKIMSNFRRGKGDLGGIASQLNDAGFVPTPVFSYWPNDYGLYNITGNVSEWVMDVYRPLSFEDVDDFNSFRGNVYTKLKLDSYGEMVDKDSMGRLVYEPVTAADNVKRRNYKVSDNIGYKDEESYNSDEQKYEYGVTTLINNKARVFKGGSWNDRAYWMSPGTRRWLDEELSTSTIGFRCAMIRVGSPIGNSKKRNKVLPSSGIGKKNKKMR